MRESMVIQQEVSCVCATPVTSSERNLNTRFKSTTGAGDAA